MRRDSRLILLYKCLKGAASIPTDDLIPPVRLQKSSLFGISNPHCKNWSFFPQSILDLYCLYMPLSPGIRTQPDWNALPNLVVSSAEGVKIAKFTSLARARTNFLFHRSWWMKFIWRVPSNNSNSDSDPHCSVGYWFLPKKTCALFSKNDRQKSHVQLRWLIIVRIKAEKQITICMWILCFRMVVHDWILFYYILKHFSSVTLNTILHSSGKASFPWIVRKYIYRYVYSVRGSFKTLDLCLAHMYISTGYVKVYLRILLKLRFTKYSCVSYVYAKN